MLILRSKLGTLLLATCGVFAIATCGSRQDVWDGDREIELCGPDPRDCDEGLIGARCDLSDDCADGVCCLSNHCGGGMCTFLCADGGDCPPDMLCDGGFCFYECQNDADCGAGQECREDETVCQY